MGAGRGAAPGLRAAEGRLEGEGRLIPGVFAFTAEAKAAEAAASAYYNPDNPHTVYMPTVGTRDGDQGWEQGGHSRLRFRGGGDLGSC